MRLRLNKSDILRGYRSYTQILTQGRSFQTGPIRCYYQQTEQFSAYHVHVGFSVVRSVRKASIRNRVKRIMKEAYRLHGKALQDRCKLSGRSMRVVFLYRATRKGKASEVRYADLEQYIVSALSQLERL